MQGYLDTKHSEQIKGEEKHHLREFAKYFNKALNYR